MSVLYVKHVPWEGAHRIAEQLGEGTSVSPLAGEALPEPDSVAAAVFMGGPMSVNETDRYPALAEEIAWIGRALESGLPLLGICLGSQLIARALGAEVGPAPRKEIGWAPVEIRGADDPLLGPLAPQTEVLHWHGEEFATPPGAERLASSALTECQAFRAGTAWGVLFHPEADRALVEAWLSERSMVEEAEAVLGPAAQVEILEGAARHERELVERSSRGFEAFASALNA